MDRARKRTFPTFPLAELHAHLSTSISPATYWQIAHDQGFKLPKKEYHEFIDHITLSQEKRMALNDYFTNIYHPLLNKLSSGVYAVERAVYESMSGAYRNNITLIELRTNPMKHNNEGEHDLDHIIMAMLRGMERSLLEYKDLSAGLLFCLAREFSYDMNEIIVEKAIKYHKRGVVGIDFAGPATDTFHFNDYRKLIEKARSNGLKITTHSGEVPNANDMWETIEHVSPERIGHGIHAVHDTRLLKHLAEKKIVLEVCPLSNLATKAVKNIEELKHIFKKLREYNVLFSINTDWPEIIENAHLWRQFLFLRDNKILSEEELETCNNIGFAVSFIPKKGLDAYL